MQSQEFIRVIRRIRGSPRPNFMPLVSFVVKNVEEDDLMRMHRLGHGVWLAGLMLAFGVFAVAVFAGDDAKEEKPAENPYAPKKGISPADLRSFIERMQDAPAPIHERPGYSEGIVEAAERILATK